MVTSSSLNADLAKQIKATVISITTGAAKLSSSTDPAATSKIVDKLKELKVMFQKAWCDPQTAEAAVRTLCRANLIDAWVAYLHNFVSPNSLDQSAASPDDPSIDPQLLQLLLLPLDFVNQPQPNGGPHILPESLTDDVQEMFFKSGGLRFQEVTHLKEFLAQRLWVVADAIRRVLRPMWRHKSWLPGLLAGLRVGHMVEIGCKAALAAGVTNRKLGYCAALLLMELLSSDVFINGGVDQGPLRLMQEQARATFRSSTPDSLLIRTLQHWWLRLPRRRPIETCQELALAASTCGMAVTIVRCGLEEAGDAFGAAWLPASDDFLAAGVSPDHIKEAKTTASWLPEPDRCE
ncbi:hypothetical protein WJX72_009119 [[Myrmecia] bisecta]|uniref:Uncharacterized protein n=1 Tax=[Myrmecia] bisecta TaxID=41462 RepID=A0AAW1R847_9CHLO